MLARRVPGQEDQPEGRAARSDRGGGARQHLRLRGAQPCRGCRRGGWPRRWRRAPARRTSAPRCWSIPSRRCSTTRSRPAARRCAIIARPPASSAISSTTSGSMTARARSARRRAAAAPSGASRRTGARRSIAGCARNRR